MYSGIFVKRTSTFFCTVFTCALLLSGCGSTLDVSRVEEAEQAAVPIITVDQYIDMTDLQDGGDLSSGDGVGALVQRLLDDESFDLSPMVDLLQDKTYGPYAGRLPVTVLPEREVIQTDRYRDFQLLDDESSDERMERFNRLLVPDGYKQYNLGEGAVFGDRQEQMFEAVPGETDALLFVSADYAMIEDNPFYYSFLPISPDRAYIEATVRMEMIDRSGDTILEISETARSDNHVNTVGGITMEASKIQPLCVEATEGAVAAIDVVTKEKLSES